MSGGSAGPPGEPGGTLPDGDTGDYLRWNGTLWVPSSWTLPLEVTANDLGEVLTADAVGSSVFRPLFQRTILQAFGSSNVSVAGVWLHPWAFFSAANASITLPGFLFAPMSGRLRDMRVRHYLLIASADDITYTLVVNGVDTSLTVTLNTGVVSATNLVDIVEVGPEDELSLRADGATATRNIRPIVQFIFEY